MPENHYERVEALQEQLANAKQRDDATAEVDTLIELGDTFEEHIDPGSGHMYYRLAETVIRSSGTREDRLHEAVGGQGRSLQRRGQYDEALGRFEDAERAAESHGDATDVARWKIRQAAVHRRLGTIETARETLAEAAARLHPESDVVSSFLEELRTGPERLQLLAEFEGQMGLVLVETDPHEAEEAYRRALDYAMAAEDADAVSTWAANLGNACSRDRRYSEAEWYYGIATEAAREADDVDGLVNAAQNMATMFGRAHRNESAAESLLSIVEAVDDARARIGLEHEALGYLERAGLWDRIVEIGTPLVEAAEREGADPEFLDEVTTRIDGARYWRDVPPDRPDEGPTALDLYVPERMAELTPADDPTDALRASDIAHLICDIAWGLPAPDEEHWQTVFSEPHLRHRVVGEAMVALCSHGMAAESLELAQRYKSVGFALPTLRRLDRDPELSTEARSYLDALDALRDAVDELRGPGGPDAFLVVERVRGAGESLLEAGTLLREHDPVLAARMGVPADLPGLVDALPLADPVAAIDLFVTGEGTLVHVVSRDSNTVYVVPFFTPHFTTVHANELLAVWAESGIAHSLGGPQFEGLLEIGSVLHDRLFCDLARQLAGGGITQLIVIPDVTIRHLPLHLALICGEEIVVPGVDTAGAEFLCDLMPTEYAPCLQAVAASQVYKRPREVATVASIADPRSDLAGAREIDRWLASQLPDSVDFGSAVGELATLDAVESALDTADVVVLGTHGHFDPDRPEESYLVLTDGRWELSSMLERPALASHPVLLLSACEVGAVAPTTDEAVGGGIPGVLVASGAASVLASLWPVEDVSMGYLVERFITHLSHRGYRPAAALFRAVRDLRQLSTEEALARCHESLDALEAADASPRQLILLENLIEWIEDADTTHPFASPVFWGGIVIVGSGWHLPAGAEVGGGAHVEDVFTALFTLHEVEEYITKGRYDEAQSMLEQLLPRLDGINRARALGALARVVWYGSSPWTATSATRRALRLLDRAELLSRAEEDDELTAYFEEIREMIESTGEIDVEQNE